MCGFFEGRNFVVFATAVCGFSTVAKGCIRRLPERCSTVHAPDLSFPSELGNAVGKECTGATDADAVKALVLQFEERRYLRPLSCGNLRPVTPRRNWNAMTAADSGKPSVGHPEFR